MANPLLNEGDRAPAFSLPATTESGTLSLDDLRGDRAVIYFYPKDDTPGCTTEACDFRDSLARLTAAGVRVVGVSPDGVASHERFRGKYDLPFPLVADTDNTMARAWGVFRMKKNYGREYEGIVRSTFLISADGTIERIWDNVKAKGHVDRILKDLAV